jgi:hypothetical protein
VSRPCPEATNANAQGSQYQLLALGAVLLASALFNAVVLRRRGAT